MINNEDLEKMKAAPEAVRAFWKIIEKAADDNRYRDGFVEWCFVEHKAEEILEKLDTEQAFHDESENG